MRNFVENADDAGAVVALAIICTLVIPCVSPAMLLLGVWSLRRARKTAIETWLLVLGTLGHVFWSIVIAYVTVEMARMAMHLPPLSNYILNK